MIAGTDVVVINCQEAMLLACNWLYYNGSTIVEIVGIVEMVWIAAMVGIAISMSNWRLHRVRLWHMSNLEWWWPIEIKVSLAGLISILHHQLWLLLFVKLAYAAATWAYPICLIRSRQLGTCLISLFTGCLVGFCTKLCVLLLNLVCLSDLLYVLITVSGGQSV